MKKHFRILFTALTLGLFILSSCEKDDDPEPKSRTVLISQASWKYAAATYGGAAVPAGTFLACQTDNVITFSAAGTGVLDEGATKCNAADPQTRNFTWTFQTNETILSLSAPLFTGGTSTFNLVTVNESQLVVSQDYTIGATTQPLIITFLH